MSAVGLGWRFFAAVSAAALVGSLAFAIWAAAEISMADFSIFTPFESFQHTLIYSLIFSWPAVALAMALLAPATDRIAPERGRRRRTLALLLGALGGIAVAIPVAFLLMDGRIWTAVPIGLIYGLSAAAAGMMILPEPNSGGKGG